MRPGGGTGLVGGIPEGRLLTQELRVFDGVAEVARLNFAGDLHLEAQPFEGHVIDLHLSGPVRTSQRLDGAKALSGTELPGHFGAVYPAGVPVEIRSPDPSEDLSVMLDAGFVRRVAAESGIDPDGFEVLHRFCFRDQLMERLADSFLPELGTGGMGGELYAEGLSQALAVHLLREHSSLGEKAKRRIDRRPRAGGLSARQLKRATDYIGDNLASGRLSLAVVASEAGYSPGHFSKLFREATGLSPHQYVIAQRVERAKALLVGTDLPLFEVARLCGFSHQQHLTTHFKRLTGATPARFRRELGR